MNLKEKIYNDMKLAMKSKDSNRLSAIRLITAGIKQIEIDEKIDLDDKRIFQILEKMVKQRKDSISQFMKGNREDLAEIERNELAVLISYLPPYLTEKEINQEIANVIIELDNPKIKDMGKIMSLLKNRFSGRVDMNLVSNLVKEYLNK
tara:strand:+ start:211 stop:657 length:447 start_codon:yes stop_codon:yes gene_type:complete